MTGNLARHQLSDESSVVFNGLRLWLIWLMICRWRVGENCSFTGCFAIYLLRLEHPHLQCQRSPVIFAQIRPCGCARHWNSMSLCYVGLPLKGEEKITVWRYSRAPVELPLAALLYRPAFVGDISSRSDEVPPEPVGAGIGLATLLEYAAASYEPQSVSRLLAALPQHKQTDTRIPAVFAVTQADFHRGWQSFLAQEYGITP